MVGAGHLCFDILCLGRSCLVFYFSCLRSLDTWFQGGIWVLLIQLGR